MFRSILGVIAGLVVGIVLIMGFEFLGVVLFPLPEGIDPMDADSRSKAMYEGRIPLVSMLAVVAGHVIASFAGSWLAAKIAGKSHLTHALIVGSILTLAGIANLIMISHSAWFAITDMFAYIPPAALGGWLARPRGV